MSRKSTTPDGPPPGADAALDTTRDRILAAAEEIFLEKGFEMATVRDICNRAEANVAAVNYHFRDKRALYCQVLRGWADRIMETYPPDLGAEPGMNGEQLLGAFVHGEMLRLLTSFDGDHAKGLRRARLVMNELTIDPPNKDLLMVMHKPAKDYLDGLLADLLGPGATPGVIDDCGNSVIGQCVHHLVGKLAGIIDPRVLESKEDIASLARRITVFSLGGIRAVRDSLP